jgi:hypothetical protein
MQPVESKNKAVRERRWIVPGVFRLVQRLDRSANNLLTRSLALYFPRGSKDAHMNYAP